MEMELPEVAERSVTTPPSVPGSAPGLGGSRWVQLSIGIVCMIMIANMQYGWTLFVVPIDQKYHWGKTAIQSAFTLFVFLETWLVPFEGYLVDRIGPKPLVLIGGALIALGWTLNAYADSISLLLIGQAVSGIGAGAIYGTCVGNAVKLFPERRGLAAGLTAAGFGMGSALTVIPIQSVIAQYGYQSAFLYFGLAQGAIVMVLSLFLRTPEMQRNASAHHSDKQIQFTWTQMIRTPIFWVMYLMFVMMATGGLIAVAQLAPIAKGFHIDATPVTLLGLTLPALTFAMSLDRILNGVTRPFFGWVSDRLGRENTMFIAFGLEAIAILLMASYGSNPVMFVLLSGLVFFGWGEIYSLFPSTCGDTYGAQHATTNAGLLYTAKGTAALLVPLSSMITTATGGWETVFYIAAGLNALAAIMAIAILKPMRKTFAARYQAGNSLPSA